MNFKSEESAEKLGGVYYTPPPLASVLAAWVMEDSPSSILEPSCGDGAFLEAIEGHLARNHQNKVKVDAVDIDPNACASLRKKVASKKFHSLATEIFESDFLELSFRMLATDTHYSAVIGNPPFIRYQYLGEKFQAATERVFEAASLPFTRHTNAWVPFVIQGLRLLQPGGRLGMVIPAEIMHVLHAQPLRDFILRHCEKVCVVDLEGRFSEKVLQGVVLLLCETRTKKSKASTRIAFPRANVSDLHNGHVVSWLRDVRFRASKGLDRKWMLGLLTDSERKVFERAATLTNVHAFVDIADVDVGIVTGANKFFLVTNDVVEKYKLHDYAKPMFGRSSHVTGVILGAQDLRENASKELPTNFIHFPPIPIENFPESVRSYLRSGEDAGLPSRFKCRVRKPWYTVPSVWPSEISMLKRAHTVPRLIFNSAHALTTDTAYRIRMKSEHAGSAKAMVASFVNSLTALSAELEGRHYGGGVIELVPSEIERLLIPLDPMFNESDLRALDVLHRLEPDMLRIVEKRDQAVLLPLGLTKGEVGILNGAWRRLMRRRHRDSDANH